ncbi:unnamed protein product [Diamesa hyperborea]
MVRRGRSASPPPAQRRAAPRAAAPAPRAAAPTQNAPAVRAPAAAAPMAAAPAMAAPSAGPGIMGQMVATAGGVAIGHTMGHALTGMLFGDKKEGAEAAPAAAAGSSHSQFDDQPQQSQSGGACAWEIKQFLQCAQNQSDLTLCDGFNEAIRQCKSANQM